MSATSVSLPEITNAVWAALELSPPNEFEVWSRVNPDNSGMILLETTSSSGSVQKYVVDIRPVQKWKQDF